MLRQCSAAAIEDQPGLVTVSAKPNLRKPLTRGEQALFEGGLQSIDVDNQPSGIFQGEVFKIVYFTVRLNDGLIR